jgi:nitroreductase
MSGERVTIKVRYESTKGSGIVVFWGEQEIEVKKILGIPEDYELGAVLKIGEPGEKPSPPPKRPESSWLHRNRF